MVRRLAGALLSAGVAWCDPAGAQRTQENTVREAEDGFGKSVGSESIGIYAAGEVRGFSVTEAGNNRIEGLYFDRQAQVSNVIVRGSDTRLGLSAFGYPFPAPTGIIDLQLRRPGSEPVVSVQLNSGEYLGTDLVVDAALPLTDRVGINLDAGLYDDQYVSGSSAWFASYGAVARWSPAADIEVTGFGARYDYGDEEQAPVLYTAGVYLPPRVERRRFYGQDWADWAGHAHNGGALVKAALGDWQVDAGLFASEFTRDQYHAAYFSGVQRDGSGRSYVVGGRDQLTGSTSGELRVARVLGEGRRRHRLVASVRGREVRARYGGFQVADLGPAIAGVPQPVAEIDFAYGPLTRDRVSQRSYALGYELRWPRVVELNVGLARTRYAKRVDTPGSAPAEESADPWLWNAAVAVFPATHLTLYAATTRGLEESGIAPANAANRGLALPALRTRQVEAGARYAFDERWRLVAAVFDVRKPYFEIDARDGAYKLLGEVAHRGVEASLSGSPTSRLSIVAGAVALRPRVTGQAVADGRLGSWPIGRTGLLVDANADWRVPALAGVSLDAHLTYEARRTADRLTTSFIPERAIVDVGLRYRTRIGRVPALWRVQVRNLADTFGWRVSSGGGFTLLPGRRATVALTVDL